MDNLTPKRIVFLNPPTKDGRKIIRTFDCGTESKGNYLYQPYDFLVLSARLRPSDELIFIDAVADRLGAQEYNKRILPLNADLFIQAFAECHWANDFSYLCSLRESHPDSTILVCGDAFLEESRRDCVRTLANGVITNPFTFDLSQALAIDKGRRCELHLLPSDCSKFGNGTKKLNLGIPRHELFLNKNYRWPFSTYFRYTSIFTTWGCPFSCSYCPVHKYPFIFRDENEIFRELTHIQTLGIREIYFADRSFGVQKTRTRNLLEKMEHNSLHFSWSAYFHPNCYDAKLLELFKKSGCHTLIIGIETTVQKKLWKFGRFVSETKLQSLLEHARSLGINVCGDFLLGLPGQGAKDIDALLFYAKKERLDYVSFNILSPLPGSSIRQEVLKQKPNLILEGGFDSQGGQGILGSDTLPSPAIRLLKEQAVFRFYARPGYLFQRLKKLRHPEHFVIQLQEMLELFKKNKTAIKRRTNA